MRRRTLDDPLELPGVGVHADPDALRHFTNLADRCTCHTLAPFFFATSIADTR
jgi:hypothetical protein